MLAEPVTTLTDYAITLEGTVLAVALLRENAVNFQKSRFFWGIAFGWVAIAAAAGGTCHGFAQILTLSVLGHLWVLMGYAVGCASFFMLLGVISSAVTGWLRWGLLLAVSCKSALYFSQVVQYEQFLSVAIDYLSAMVVVVLLQLRQLTNPLLHQRQSALWILGGIGISLLAIGIQAMQLSLAPAFNHNDLYHLVQMVAFYLLYRGARILKDR